MIGSKVTAVFLNRWSCIGQCLRLSYVSDRAGSDQNQETGFQDVAAETKGVIEVNLIYTYIWWRKKTFSELHSYLNLDFR